MTAGKIIYDSPIGAMPDGTPMGGTLAGNALEGLPIPNLNFNGGAAAPSGAVTGDVKSSVYNTSGGGGLFWVFLGAVIWIAANKVRK